MSWEHDIEKWVKDAVQDAISPITDTINKLAEKVEGVEGDVDKIQHVLSNLPNDVGNIFHDFNDLINVFENYGKDIEDHFITALNGYVNYINHLTFDQAKGAVLIQKFEGELTKLEQNISDLGSLGDGKVISSYITTKLTSAIDQFKWALHASPDPVISALTKVDELLDISGITVKISDLISSLDQGIKYLYPQNETKNSESSSDDNIGLIWTMMEADACLSLVKETIDYIISSFPLSANVGGIAGAVGIADVSVGIKPINVTASLLGFYQIFLNTLLKISDNLIRLISMAIHSPDSGNLFFLNKKMAIGDN